MTAVQMGLTIAVCTAATMLTRFLPFVVFSSKDQQPPEVVRYLGRVLPAAIFGMLIVYCLKSVTPFAGSRGIPEAIALLVTVGLHKWKHETLLSVAGGTLCYVLLVQLASSEVLFDVLSEDEILYYVDRYQPMDKAGAYGVQEWIGYIGVKSISGSFYNIMGLPIQKLYGELKKL